MAVCTTTLPTANADLCVFNLKFGRINKLLYTRAESTDAISDASSSAAWNARLSNSTALTASGTAAPIRYLYVTGEWPLPERTKIDVSNGRTAYTSPKHTLTLSVDDVGDTNAALLASEQGATKRRKVWLEIDGQLWGGNSGYEMDMTFMGRVVPGSNQEKQTIQIQLEYEGAQTAPIASVLSI